jgi:hypothetical protein
MEHLNHTRSGQDSNQNCLRIENLLLRIKANLFLAPEANKASAGVHLEARLLLIRSSIALGDYESDVIVLFTTAKPAHFIEDETHNSFRRPLTILSQRFDQTLLPEFASRSIEGFGYAIRVKSQQVSWKKLSLL